MSDTKPAGGLEKKILGGAVGGTLGALLPAMYYGGTIAATLALGPLYPAAAIVGTLLGYKLS